MASLVYGDDVVVGVIDDARVGDHIDVTPAPGEWAGEWLVVKCVRRTTFDADTGWRYGLAFVYVEPASLEARVWLARKL